MNFVGFCYRDVLVLLNKIHRFKPNGDRTISMISPLGMG